SPMPPHLHTHSLYSTTSTNTPFHTLSLHDALPIYQFGRGGRGRIGRVGVAEAVPLHPFGVRPDLRFGGQAAPRVVQVEVVLGVEVPVLGGPQPVEHGGVDVVGVGVEKRGLLRDRGRSRRRRPGGCRSRGIPRRLHVPPPASHRFWGGHSPDRRPCPRPRM